MYPVYVITILTGHDGELNLRLRSLQGPQRLADVLAAVGRESAHNLETSLLLHHISGLGDIINVLAVSEPLDPVSESFAPAVKLRPLSSLYLIG